jgi:fatty-acyl-CoA synthase
MTSYARDWVVWQADNRPDAPALRNGDTGWLVTWGQLEERISRLAGHLRQEYGTGKGDRVAVIAYGDPRIFELQFACMRIGAIMVPLNWRLADQELQDLLARSAPITLLWDGPMRERAAALSNTAGLKPGFGWDEADSSAGYEERIAQARPVTARVDIEYDEVTHILYTSGTTGLPKGALTTQRNMAAQAISNAHTSGVAEPGCHHLNPMPLFHAGGLHSLANPILYFGGQVTTLARYVPSQTLDAMSRYRTTHFNSIPAFFADMAALPEWETTDISSMRLCVVAGAVAQPAVLGAWHARGIAMQPQYGSTETGPTVTALVPPRDLDMAQRGTAGQRVPHVEVRLVDTKGRDVRDGAEGELWVLGPAITPGYWQADPAEYFTDGWLRTGDVARRQDGHYYIVGRSKEMYKSGGENVYPAEVERALATMPGLQDIAVIGVPDARWGEVGMAVVVPMTGSRLDLAALRDYGQSRLAKYKLPQRFVSVPELPRNVTGKVNRVLLKDQYGGLV